MIGSDAYNVRILQNIQKGITGDNVGGSDYNLLKAILGNLQPSNSVNINNTLKDLNKWFGNFPLNDIKTENVEFYLSRYTQAVGSCVVYLLVNDNMSSIPASQSYLIFDMFGNVDVCLSTSDSDRYIFNNRGLYFVIRIK